VISPHDFASRFAVSATPNKINGQGGIGDRLNLARPMFGSDLLEGFGPRRFAQRGHTSLALKIWRMNGSGDERQKLPLEGSMIGFGTSA